METPTKAMKMQPMPIMANIQWFNSLSSAEKEGLWLVWHPEQPPNDLIIKRKLTTLNIIGKIYLILQSFDINCKKVINHSTK